MRKIIFVLGLLAVFGMAVFSNSSLIADNVEASNEHQYMSCGTPCIGSGGG